MEPAQKSMAIKIAIILGVLGFVIVSTLAATGAFNSVGESDDSDAPVAAIDPPQQSGPPRGRNGGGRGGGGGGGRGPRYNDLTVSLKGDRSLHVQHGGRKDADTVFVLVHGGNRRLQNASYWEFLYPYLGNKGMYLSFDNLGHGTSVPGKKDDARAVTRQMELNAIKAVELLIPANTEKKLRRNIVIIARSYGGGLATNLIANNPHLAAKLVLIAPGEPDPDVKPGAIDTPTLMIWAKEDPIMDYANHEKYMARFTNLTFYESDSKSHYPEMMKPDEFRAQLDKFLDKYADERGPPLLPHKIAGLGNNAGAGAGNGNNAGGNAGGNGGGNGQQNGNQQGGNQQNGNQQGGNQQGGNQQGGNNNAGGQQGNNNNDNNNNNAGGRNNMVVV